MTRVYVAARFADKALAESHGRRLRAAGLHVVSRWHALESAHGTADETALCRETRRAIAAQNYHDLAAADALVCLAHPDGRGTLMELADAYARGLHVVVIGSPYELTLMADRPHVEWVETIEQAIARINNPGPRCDW